MKNDEKWWKMMVDSLWLCQNSYWTWPFIVDLPVEPWTMMSDSWFMMDWFSFTHQFILIIPPVFLLKRAFYSHSLYSQTVFVSCRTAPRPQGARGESATLRWEAPGGNANGEAAGAGDALRWRNHLGRKQKGGEPLYTNKYIYNIVIINIYIYIYLF